MARKNSVFSFCTGLDFHLPEGYTFFRDTDENGNDICVIQAGEYLSDDGEISYRLRCRIQEGTVNYLKDQKPSHNEILETVAKDRENTKYFLLPGPPHGMFMSMGLPLSFFGKTLKTFGLTLMLMVNDTTFVNCIVSGQVNDSDPSEHLRCFENILNVAKTVRINGNTLNLGRLTAQMLEDCLLPSFGDDEGAIDISPKIRFAFTAGDETTTYEYTAEGMKEIGKERLTRVSPTEELFPHYSIIRSAGSLGFLGTTVVVNASGTEYSFIPLKHIAQDDDVNDDLKALYNRVISKDTERYDLHEKAREMQKLFHVNKSAFDPHHDRECELEDGLMHRAYMMSGLRSFAWTLADYCKQHNCMPKDLDCLIASRIANFVAGEDWLNYDGDTYCQGLCSGSDLHVYFIPDGVAQADKKRLLPSKEDMDRIRQMKEKFPAYREILSEVHSLNALRKDLEYIYPAIKTLWDKLEEDRDYSQALLGNEADIVYAWCALALAAKEPFFSEDGPMSCFFTQLPEPAASANTKTKSVGKTKAAGKMYTIEGERLTAYNGKAYTPEIPGDIQVIGTGAFNENSELGCTEIPERVAVIETGAFRNCPNLFRIIIPNIPIRIEKDAFINCPKLYIDTVPNSAAEKYCKENGIPCRTDALCAKLYTDSAKQKGKKKPKDTAIVGYSEYGFPLAEVEEGRKRLLDRKPKKTDGPNRFDLYLHTWNSSHGIALYYYDKIWPGYLKGRADLLQAADELVKLFRDDNLEYDVESELRQGLIRRGRTMHVLRSFVWTSVEYCKNTKKELADFSIEKSIQLAQFIFDRGGANYQPAGKTTKRIGAGLLTKSEKDHGYNEESYVALIRSLVAFLPIMKRIYDYFSEKQRAYSDAENTLKDVLAGWCAYALACFGEFHVEAGPEDYTPPKCRELPVDAGQLRVLNKHYYVDQANICVAYTGSGDTIDFPEGVQRVNIPEKYSDISGSKQYWNHSGTVIFPTTCSVCSNEYSSVNEHCSKSIKRLVIKGAVDTIASRYLPYKETVCLEQLEFLGTGNAVKNYAFSTEYPRLKKVVLPENLSTIGENAFYNTPMLKEIRIPPNVSKIGDGAFKQYDNNTKVLIVEKGSIAELVVQQFVAGKNYLSCRVVLSEAEQKRIEEENRLKRIAATLEQKLSALYRDLLDEGHRESLKLAVSSAITDTCDRQTWGEIRKRKIPAIPMANLSETHKKLESVAPEEAYDLLPEWIAEEYIHTAEEKRIQHLRAEEEKKARLAFETIIRELNGIANESVLPLFENGIGKNEILKQFASRAKTVVGDGVIINSGLAKYIGNATLETLKLSLGRKPFDSAASLVDAVIEKKSSEIDRLTSLLEKKNSDLEAIEKEKASLEEERSHLGFFQGKRKKEIAALLEKIPERIKQVEDEYETAKSKI